MSSTATKNVVASVLARLRNHSKSRGVPFQQVLQQYAIERFLYRVSKSKHAQTVILKGALLLKTIGISGARPTMDIDMLREGKADQASLVALVKDCATLEVQADGLTFLADSVTAEEITKGDFADQHRVQWNAFVRKMGEDELTDAFGKVVAELRMFALPLLRSLARGEEFAQQSKAGDGWVR